MTVVLLTGFEPFAGADCNPSWDAVRAVHRTWRHPETLEIACLPVEFARAGDELEALLDRLRPDLVVATGLADGRDGVTPERVAINVHDARIPDNAGASPVDEPIVPGGPAAYFSTLPIKSAVAAMSQNGVPAAVSQTAGTFVCNSVFYRLRHAIETRGWHTPAGFVHVPASPRSAGVSGMPTVPTDTVALALSTILRVCLDNPVDVAIPGGSEH